MRVLLRTATTAATTVVSRFLFGNMVQPRGHACNDTKRIGIVRLVIRLLFVLFDVFLVGEVFRVVRMDRDGGGLTFLHIKRGDTSGSCFP